MERTQMNNKLTLQDLLNTHDFESIEDVIGYIDYLEEVQADYEYLKEKFKNLIDEIDKLY